MTKKLNQGFIALTTALVLSVVFLSVGIGAAKIAISGGQESLTYYFSEKARILAESCAEYSLLKLQESIDYPGNETVVIGGETCEIQAVGGSGNTDRVVRTVSTVSGHILKIEVIISTIYPEIQISSFKTVVDF